MHLICIKNKFDRLESTNYLFEVTLCSGEARNEDPLDEERRLWGRGGGTGPR